MANPIEDYRQARDTYKKLQGEAKKALLTRHQELSSELLQIQKELREEFGLRVSFPGKAKGSANKKASAKTAPVSTATEQPVKVDPKVVAIQKRLAAQKRKLDEASKSGKDTKALKDRIFELEDDLRLATTP